MSFFSPSFCSSFSKFKHSIVTKFSECRFYLSLFVTYSPDMMDDYYAPSKTIYQLGILLYILKRKCVYAYKCCSYAIVH